ncbi:MAG: hypothetical protein A2Y17_07400 [Clostridiales bacterium GWF2_38_85]|nr:MAG: hypothetical protein A2Y17_07400 [Clostridiales bacterium GWF2_38_85]HBL84302.1 hypothetical protein [Clostridiales bacterium]
MEFINDKCKNMPRILVISCNCFHTQNNNGKTILQQFSSWPTDCLAQFYTYPEVPDNILCKNFYRITDIDVINYVLHKSKTCGMEIEVDLQKNDNLIIQPKTKPHIFYSNIRNWNVCRLIRDIVWENAKWENAGLKKWIYKFAPEAIYFLGLNNPYLFNLANNIATELNIPIIIYATDDYYLPRITASPFFWIRYLILNRCMKRILKRPDCYLLTINETMSQIYKQRFNKSSDIFMNCVDIPLLDNLPEVQNGKIVISYVGNLSHNRWKSILYLIKTIENSNLHSLIKIDIYCGEHIPKKVSFKLSLIKLISLKDKIKKEQVMEVLKCSDVLLHVESFNYRDRMMTKLSFSTKLTEYIAAGRPILSFAPSSVASMQILEKYNAAICIDSKIKSKIIEKINILTINSEREKIRKNAYNFLIDIYTKYSMKNLLEIKYNELLRK